MVIAFAAVAAFRNNHFVADFHYLGFRAVRQIMNYGSHGNIQSHVRAGLTVVILAFAVFASLGGKLFFVSKAVQRVQIRDTQKKDVSAVSPRAPVGPRDFIFLLKATAPRPPCPPEIPIVMSSISIASF